MRPSFLIPILVFSVRGFAATAPGQIKFNYVDAEIGKMIQDYSAAAGQRFVVDANVKGRVTLLNRGPIPVADAFDELSMALAGEGFGIVADGGVMRVRQARMLQRGDLPVVLEVPSERPERMVTWVYRAKHVPAEEINKQLRILTSRDGELVTFGPGNVLVVTDWTSSLKRIAAILAEIDVDPRAGRP